MSDHRPMILATKVLRPGAPRIGRITENIVLPRTVPIPGLIGGLLGGIVGVLLGLMLGFVPSIDTVTGIFVGIFVGGAGGVGLVQWRPWKGEHAGRVALVRYGAARAARQVHCPGSGKATLYDPDIGADICVQCLVVINSVEGLATTHQWKRRLYIGMQPVGQPQTGAVRMVVGSQPLSRR